MFLHNVGSLAQKRLARGVRLNEFEATALIAAVLQERIRDGKHSVAELMQHGKTLLGRRHVLHGVAEQVREVMIEGTFLDGSFLVTVHDPICTDDGDLANALYGSFLPIPDNKLFELSPEDKARIDNHLPGAIVISPKAEDIILLPQRRRIAMQVTNTGDRPIQVGSHYPFHETNPTLLFPRLAAIGFRLDICAGTAVRFEPGDVKTVSLVQIGGQRSLAGGNSLYTGSLDALLSDQALQTNVKQRFIEGGFADADQAGYAALQHLPAPAPFAVSRQTYLSMYGPTIGDQIRLGDSALWIEVERDMTVYGDGKQTRSFQYIHDLIDGLIALMSSDETRPVNIGNSDEFTIGEFAELVREIVEKVQKEDGDTPVKRVQIVYKPMPTDDPQKRRPDTTRAKESLQWQPRWTVRMGLEEMVRYYKAKMEEGSL